MAESQHTANAGEHAWTIPGRDDSPKACIDVTKHVPHGYHTAIPLGLRCQEGLTATTDRGPTDPLWTSLLLFCAVFVEVALGLLIGSLTHIHATPHLDLLVGK
jgi:hypothetical protein